MLNELTLLKIEAPDFIQPLIKLCSEIDLLCTRIKEERDFNEQKKLTLELAIRYKSLLSNILGFLKDKKRKEKVMFVEDLQVRIDHIENQFKGIKEDNILAFLYAPLFEVQDTILSLLEAKKAANKKPKDNYYNLVIEEEKEKERIEKAYFAIQEYTEYLEGLEEEKDFIDDLKKERIKNIIREHIDYIPEEDIIFKDLRAKRKDRKTKDFFVLKDDYEREFKEIFVGLLMAKAGIETKPEPMGKPR